MDIGGWLRRLGLERYEAAFRENEIDETVLPTVTAEDLKDLGVDVVGHRRKLLNAERGAPFTPASFNWMIKRAGQKAGLPFQVHAHMLRHSAGYKLAVTGTIHARSRTIWVIGTFGTRSATRRFSPSRSGISGATELAA
jgi:integrase